MLAPTGSGKTLAAFLSAIHQVMFSAMPAKMERCRVLYISPLKALAVDIERNLRFPIAGIVKEASTRAEGCITPAIAIRTGDTPSQERARFGRSPADILITTPESLFLLLTSKAREVLRSVRFVIVDEIHTMANTKRGVHLAVSLERLQRLADHPFQRIGLSATQRPLEEVARFLGGGEVAENGTWKERPVKIVNAGGAKELDLEVSMPVEDMSRLGEPMVDSPRTKGGESVRRSIWPSIYPRVLDLIRKHRTTLIFVNNRRLAERMASALNELAGQPLARAHHGSVAREQRLQMEDELKQGLIPAIVATSSLELGIDMGSIDLVIQIESPASVASALQRIGRAGHQRGASSKGIILPKFRGDLVACAAITTLMLKGRVEETRMIRNPLDVLAQQIVSILAMDAWNISDLEILIRRAAPYSNLTRAALENVLDLLAGRYPSEEFRELHPRIVWNRASGMLRARQGAKAVAIANAGTIPDRGLYGVFMLGAEKAHARVGELDEEMVFETKPGEVFLLGTSSWRVEEIKHDRVLVSPAPGQPGKMPFWHGDTAGRPLEFGRHIGALMRTLQTKTSESAMQFLMAEHRLDDWAAKNVIAYIQEQQTKGGAVPDDRTIIVERNLDELGDWRVCILSPFGGKVHAPWTHVIEAVIREKSGLDVETLWSDDGIVVRFPETDDPPATDLLFPDSAELEELLMKQMGSSALFAARFREAAGRALMLPRRFPGQRKALWQQRRKASDLLSIAARYPQFPIVLETYRELLQDVFDVPGLRELLREIHGRAIRVITVDTRTPSPFASSLLFGYVGNFMYEGDAPLAERRAQALSIDQSQLRELMGEVELRELLDPEVMQAVEQQLQHLSPTRPMTGPDAIHDLLLRNGDLSAHEIAERSMQSTNTIEEWLRELRNETRCLEVKVAKEVRWIAIEDASRYRDALGVRIGAGVPETFQQPVANPVEDLLMRFARTHGPFTVNAVASRFGLSEKAADQHLTALAKAGRILEGAYRRGVEQKEWCEPDVLARIRQKSLARLREQIEPVPPSAYGRFLPAWHRLDSPARAGSALVDAIAQLQGYPIPASVLESDILAARIKDYNASELDQLMASGFVLWVGLEPLGKNDGRIALFLSEHAGKLFKKPAPIKNQKDIHKNIQEYLQKSGASFFPQIVSGIGGGFKREISSALWDLVWSGQVTNDTMHSLRAYVSSQKKRKRGEETNTTYFGMAPEVAGRWSLVEQVVGTFVSPTEHAASLARQLLERNGVVTRDVFHAESIEGGFASLYPILKALEEAGKIQRGYFIEGRGAAQFASSAALDRLRSFREPEDQPGIVVLAAADPANPYGATLPWPIREDNRIPGRAAGAMVILINGELAAYFGRSEKMLLTFLNVAEMDQQRYSEGVARALADLVRHGHRRAIFITQIDGLPPGESRLAPDLQREGFVAYSQGWQFKKKL